MAVDGQPEARVTLGSGALQGILERTAKSLDMDVAFLAEFDGDRLVFRALGGDAESFGWEEGESIPMEGSYCKLVADEALPSAVSDAGADETVRNLEVTRAAGIGSYVGFPLRLSDGSVYGTVCCASHSPDPWLAERYLSLMGNLASKLVATLEREGKL